ncbi:MAG: DNA-processing protein DprA, partial [Chryseotalea sp.]
CVAIVGTRQASDYGKSFVEKLIEELIPHQPLIISGLAYGIDIAAHKACVKHNLQTLGVLGSGIDVVYPAAHKETARRMCDNGGLISEQPFGTKPDAFNFPARNRIIAGLSDLIIVVEAADKGGALITAEIANSYNKEVMAVPGSVFSLQSVGCHQLIKQNKAHLLSDVKDIEYLMNWEPGIDKKEKEIPQDLTENELKVFQQLSVEHKKTMDEISWGSAIPIQQVAGILLNLEFRGLVKAFPGNQFKKIYN